MFLRSLTQHLKDHNWFAVALDFVIVVVGVGVALAGQQALSNFQARSNYERALLDLRSGINNVYGTAKERVALTECRKTRYRELGTLLLQTDTPWAGSSKEYDFDALTPVFLRVTRSPQRLWTTSFWDSELATGTFDLMDHDKRFLLSIIFASGTLMEQKFQFKISDIEANLQALAYPLDLSLSDRLHYFDLLTRADTASETMELVAGQMIGNLEATGLLTPLNAEEAAEHRDRLDQENTELVAMYGDCIAPMTYPYLEKLGDTEVKKL
jgi:hypothetical protein